MLSDHRGCYFLIHLSDSLHCLAISPMVIPPASHQAIWSRSSAVILWCFFIPIAYWVSPYCSDPKLNLGREHMYQKVSSVAGDARGFPTLI
jgi:hypothetical protein